MSIQTPILPQLVAFRTAQQRLSQLIEFCERNEMPSGILRELHATHATINAYAISLVEDLLQARGNSNVKQD